MDLQHLSPGHSILEPTVLPLGMEEVQEYLAAVEDAQTLYQERGIIPPMALAARAVRDLIIRLALPPGTVHIAQEVESLAPCPAGAALTLESQVSQNNVRGEWRFLGIAFEVRREEGGSVVLRGKSTVLVPVAVRE